jgi:hypothetical protein
MTQKLVSKEVIDNVLYIEIEVKIGKEKDLFSWCSDYPLVVEPFNGSIKKYNELEILDTITQYK